MGFARAGLRRTSSSSTGAGRVPPARRRARPSAHPLQRRGKTSGLKLEQMRAEGANLFHLRGGRVTRFVVYLDRERAFADVGLKEWAMSHACPGCLRTAHRAPALDRLHHTATARDPRAPRTRPFTAWGTTRRTGTHPTTHPRSLKAEGGGPPNANPE